MSEGLENSWNRSWRVGKSRVGGVLEVDHLSWALTIGRVCMGCQRREDYRAKYLSQILQMAGNKLEGWTDGWMDGWMDDG